MRNLKMRKVAKEIIDLKIPKSTLNNLKKKFYQIMRKNNIKEGEWNTNGNSRRIANPEWTMCKDLFINSLKEKLNWQFFFDTPEDLEAYKKKLNKEE